MKFRFPIILTTINWLLGKYLLQNFHCFQLKDQDGEHITCGVSWVNSKLMCLKFQWEKEDLCLSLAIRINSPFLCFVLTVVLKGEKLFLNILIVEIYEPDLSVTQHKRTFKIMQHSHSDIFKIVSKDLKELRLYFKEGARRVAASA